MQVAKVALLMVVFVGTAFAGDKRAEAEALFARANGALGFGASSPYTVKGHIRVAELGEGGVIQSQEGTFSKFVLRAGVSRSEITLPAYSEIVVRNGERQWIRRNVPFTPVRVERLVAALGPHLTIYDKDKVEKVLEEVIGGVHSKCVTLRTKVGNREVCMDATTGLPLREKSSSGFQEQVDYESYSVYGDKQFPHTIHVTEAGAIVAEFSLESLSADLPDKSLFDPLADAVVLPVCDDMKIKPPVPISTPDPAYPETDRRNRVQGVVLLQMVIDEEGKTHNVMVIRSLNPRLDAEAKAAVLKWRFQPAMCDTSPVSRGMKVEVAFRLY